MGSVLSFPAPGLKNGGRNAFMGPFNGLLIFPVNPALPFPATHQIIVAPHDQQVVKGFTEISGVSGYRPETHRKPGCEIAHIMPIPFGHIQDISMAEISLKSPGVLKCWPGLKVRGGEIYPFVGYQGVGNLVEDSVFGLRKKEDLLFPFKMEVKYIGKVNVVMHKGIRIPSPKE